MMLAFTIKTCWIFAQKSFMAENNNMYLQNGTYWNFNRNFIQSVISRSHACDMSRIARKPVFGVSDQVRHKPGFTTIEDMAGSLKFRILEVEGLYYPFSENKGADQLCGYRKADLRLCFSICK